MVRRVRDFFASLLPACLLAVFLMVPTSKVQAQSTEERFQDLFVTAGYATAFGAALGAAMLSFVPDPASELRYVAIGASLGFIGGSVMGTYVIFSPMLSMDNKMDDKMDGTPSSGHQLAAVEPQSRPGLLIRPEVSTKTGGLKSVTGQWTLATF